MLFPSCRLPDVLMARACNRFSVLKGDEMALELDAEERSERSWDVGMRTMV